MTELQKFLWPASFFASWIAFRQFRERSQGRYQKTVVNKPNSAAGLVSLTKGESDFLEANEMCRFATASAKGEPHVVPVSYVWDNDKAVIVTDYKTKKLKNLREKPSRGHSGRHERNTETVAGQWTGRDY